MNAQTLTSRIRARHSGFVSPLTRRPVFRIEDGDGQVLRRISSARSLDEAIAHYWRSAGSDVTFEAAMPDQPPDAALRRRIASARGARGRADAVHDAMQTHELALPDLPADEVFERVSEPADPIEPSSSEAASPKRTRAAAPVRRRPAKPKTQPEDLFETPGEPEAVAFAPEMPSVAPEPEPEPEPALESVVTPEPELEPDVGAAAPYHLDPQTVMLQQVDHRNLRPTDRPDSYLYHVTNRSEASFALENGLAVSASDPIILTERPGVAYWLSVLAEDYDYILDGPADFVVLRMRRFTVEILLEPDPETSRSAGCGCYLLTGAPGMKVPA